MKSDCRRTTGSSCSRTLTVSSTDTPFVYLGELFDFNSSVVSPMMPNRMPFAVTMVYFMISDCARRVPDGVHRINRRSALEVVAQEGSGGNIPGIENEVGLRFADNR